MPAPTTRESYWAMWRAAGRADKPLHFVCPDSRQAHVLRMHLYNAIRGMRADPDKCGGDDELRKAVLECQCTITGPDKNILVVGRPELDETLTKILASAGITPDMIRPMKTRQAAEEEAVLARILAKQASGDVKSLEELGLAPPVPQAQQRSEPPPTFVPGLDTTLSIEQAPEGYDENAPVMPKRYPRRGDV